VKLVEVIGDSEIIRVCERCVFQNNFPVIKKPNVEQMKDLSRFTGVKERLSEQAGVDLRKHENKEIDIELEKLVAENFKAGDYDELIDNFHWTILHSRRLKKISQKQLAESVAEPEIAIAMAEKGNLPEDYKKIIGKLEQFLGVKLFKEKVDLDKGIDLKNINPEEVTVGELKEISNKELDDDVKLDRKIILDDVASKLGEKKKKGFWDRFKGEEDFDEENLE
jgi:ribosome-binding protein aMBF1 (putative translation factor)